MTSNTTMPFPGSPAVRERPILFSAPMVRALLAGTKTQTRRVMKPQPYVDEMGNACWKGLNFGQSIDAVPHMTAMASPLPSSRTKRVHCPYGAAGDRLYVRETFDPIYPQDPSYNGGRPIEYDYRSTYNHGDRLGDSLGIKKTWKPAIHMPRAASRILLEVTDVRIERLQDISEADAMAEGIERSPSMGKPGAFQWCDYRIPHDAAEWFNSPIHSYETLWDQINGAGAWAANPWVWAVSVRRVPPTGGISNSPPGGSKE